MLPIAYNAYFDPILRTHIERAARRQGVAIESLERSFGGPSDAVEFLRVTDPDEYTRYTEAASAAVDHVGWIVVGRRRGRAVSSA